MDSAEFASIRAALPSLMTLSSLAGTNSDIRADGVPQNWVNDIQSLTNGQRTTLAGDIGANAPAWALALKNHLLPS